MSEIHVGDIGTVFKVKIVDDDTGDAIDISLCLIKEIKFAKPDGDTVVTYTASFTTDGTDGFIQYSTLAGDLDVHGRWEVQGRIVHPTFTNSSKIGSFIVKPNL